MNGLTELRQKIDNIDEQMVKLLASRSVLVAEAANYKKNLADVSAPARVDEVIAKVGKLAEQYGLERTIAEQVYRTMIKCFIEAETSVYKSIAKK
jgi:isochorismate pyruvate lyase